jgi:excisionase family DNA binding protein
LNVNKNQTNITLSLPGIAGEEKDMENTIERPLGIAEAAEFTGLKSSYLYKLIHLKRIPHYKPTGGRVFFKREELEQFIFRGRSAADYEISDAADQALNSGRA